MPDFLIPAAIAFVKLYSMLPQIGSVSIPAPVRKAYPLHVAYHLAEGLHLPPVRELNDGRGIRRALGDQHDEPDHHAIKKRVFRIVQFAGKDFQLLRLP